MNNWSDINILKIIKGSVICLLTKSSKELFLSPLTLCLFLTCVYVYIYFIFVFIHIKSKRYTDGSSEILSQILVLSLADT